MKMLGSLQTPPQSLLAIKMKIFEHKLVDIFKNKIKQRTLNIVSFFNCGSTSHVDKDKIVKNGFTLKTINGR